MNMAHLFPLMAALNARDPYTENHCHRVERFATALGKACGLPSGELEILDASALLHDVGKIGIPDRVLLKPGKLDPEEWATMKSHPEIGERIVAAIPLPGTQEVARIVRHHHEAFDGSGYPDGLAGESIPLTARILAIADSYDAMATTRPYQRARPHEAIMEILEEGAGRKYDPLLHRKFIQLMESPDWRGLRAPNRGNVMVAMGPDQAARESQAASGQTGKKAPALV